MRCTQEQEHPRTARKVVQAYSETVPVSQVGESAVLISKGGNSCLISHFCHLKNVLKHGLQPHRPGWAIENSPFPIGLVEDGNTFPWYPRPMAWV